MSPKNEFLGYYALFIFSIPLLPIQVSPTRLGIGFAETKTIRLRNSSLAHETWRRVRISFADIFFGKSLRSLAEHIADKELSYTTDTEFSLTTYSGESRLPSDITKKKKTSQVFFLCGRWDLNPHENPFT